MISDDERTVLRDNGLDSWRLANGRHELVERAVSAQVTAVGAIDRANRAIERGLRELELSGAARRSRSDRAKIVVADERVAERVLLVHALRNDSRVEVVADAVDGTEALANCVVAQPDVVVLDDRLPTISGLDIAAHLRLYAPRTRSILLVDAHDPLFFRRPAVVDAIAPRYGDRRHLVALVAHLAG
jgi:PleD family two-component response regulator